MDKTEKLRMELRKLTDSKQAENNLSDPDLVKYALSIEQLLYLRFTEVNAQWFIYGQKNKYSVINEIIHIYRRVFFYIKYVTNG